MSQSGISWWLNKLFDFWIILRLTEFETWAACNVLLAQKDELCYWQRRLANDIFYHYSPVQNSCSLQPAPAAWMNTSRPGSKVQFTIFSRLLWPAAQYRVTLQPERTDTYFFGTINEHCPLYKGFWELSWYSNLNQNVTASRVCLWALQSCSWSQRKPSNFISALGPLSVDYKIIKHSLSIAYSLSNSHSSSFLLFSPSIYSLKTILCYLLKRITCLSTLPPLTIHNLFFVSHS